MMMAFASAMAVDISGMRSKHIILIGVTLLLLSCGNSNGGKNDLPIDGGHGIGIDTAKINEIQLYEDSIKPKGVSYKSTNTILPSSSTLRVDDDEPDNMSGFDPPSEDDTDDNGMTRYMEVNDKEGWD